MRALFMAGPMAGGITPLEVLCFLRIGDSTVGGDESGVWADSRVEIAVISESL
jgi:hypothetical protein